MDSGVKLGAHDSEVPDHIAHTPQVHDENENVFDRDFGAALNLLEPHPISVQVTFKTVDQHVPLSSLESSSQKQPRTQKPQNVRQPTTVDRRTSPRDMLLSEMTIWIKALPAGSPLVGVVGVGFHMPLETRTSLECSWEKFERDVSELCRCTSFE